MEYGIPFQAVNKHYSVSNQFLNVSGLRFTSSQGKPPKRKKDIETSQQELLQTEQEDEKSAEKENCL